MLEAMKFFFPKIFCVEHLLEGHSLVKLMTLNKALLGRQHKNLNHFVHQFFCFEFAWFDFTCFDLYVLPCAEVLRLLRRRRDSMESLVQALGRSRVECREFSTLRKIF